VSRRPRLVVLRALGLGDLCAALPALRALRAAFPGHEIVLAAPRALAPLARLSRAVDDVVDTAPLARLSPSLRGADVAVNLHGRGPHSHCLLLALEPGRLLAFAHPAVPRSAGLPAFVPEEHEVLRWCRLLDELGVPADPSRLDLPWPDVSLPSWWRGCTVVHPGAKSAARRWPTERWAEVARAEARRGRRVLVTGSVHEVELAKAVAGAAGLAPSAVLAGRTDVLELAALVGHAARVVCGDTGVAHLATAFGTPSVVLFGPTPPSSWGPPPERAEHIALWTGQRGDALAPTGDAGLLALGVEQVLAALAALPPRAAAPP
jgi:ADP-heptose:LPS heptosyltransferase